ERAAEPVAPRHVAARADRRRRERGHHRCVLAARAPVRSREDQGAARAGARHGAGARHRAPAAAGVSQPLPERARRHAAWRLALGGHARERRARDRRNRGHPPGPPAGAAGAHLRSVLHHQVDRPRHRPRAVDYLRHRARARRDDSLRQRGGSGDALHADAAGRAGGGARGAGEIIMPTSRHGTILVVDDEEIMREILETLLTREGYDVRVASSGAEGLEMARALPFDAAIVDIMMPGLDGIATLDELKRIDEDLAVIIITAYASVESAISAMKAGAFDYITKPFKNDEVMVVVRNAMERRRLVSENRNLRQNIQERYHKFANIIGRSPRMRQVFDLIIQAAPSRSTILIQGESGTGKELVARAIHANSSRSERSFVTVNSGNLPPDLLESTLFGHVKGAFTGAVYPKKGMFDLADKGSIF